MVSIQLHNIATLSIIMTVLVVMSTWQRVSRDLSGGFPPHEKHFLVNASSVQKASGFKVTSLLHILSCCSTTDIEKAFLVIEVDPEDRDVLRFLWVKDVHADEPEIVPLRLYLLQLIFADGSSCNAVPNLIMSRT